MAEGAALDGTVRLQDWWRPGGRGHGADGAAASWADGELGTPDGPGGAGLHATTPAPAAAAAARDPWPLGPAPPPAALTGATRLSLGAFLTLALWWIAVQLPGGLTLWPPAWWPEPAGPVPEAGGPPRPYTTDKLFNIHIVCMLAAFACVAEAVIKFRAGGGAGGPGPAAGGGAAAGPAGRLRRKRAHGALQAAAVGLVAAGLAAAFTSHLARVPVVVSLYSTHSWLGLLAAGALVSNLALGAYAFALQAPDARRRAQLRPLHAFLGAVGLALLVTAMATGLQEKQTFAQGAAARGDNYAAVMRVPVALQLLLAATALGTALHLLDPAPAAAAGSPAAASRAEGRPALHYAEAAGAEAVAAAAAGADGDSDALRQPLLVDH